MKKDARSFVVFKITFSSKTTLLKIGDVEYQDFKISVGVYVHSQWCASARFVSNTVLKALKMYTYNTFNNAVFYKLYGD